MTLSQRLTRAGATFIILGTVAIILPNQAETASADGNCSSNASYALLFANSGTGTTDTTAFTMPVVNPPATMGKTGASANLVFPMIAYNGTNRKVNDATFTSYGETVTFNNNSSSAGSITGGSQSQAGVMPETAQPNNSNTFSVTKGNGYALSFTESQTGTSGSFTDSVTVTDSSNSNANVTLSETASLSG